MKLHKKTGYMSEPIIYRVSDMYVFEKLMEFIKQISFRSIFFEKNSLRTRN